MKPSVLLVLLSLSLAACGGRGARQDDTAVVVSAIGERLPQASPRMGALGTPAQVLLGAVAQGLVRFDAAGQVEPGLAERWIVIDEGRSYIFRLREATWPDGTRVTASQVVRILRQAARPRSDNALSPFLQVIDEIVEMTPEVIEVRLKQPRPDLLALFAQPELAVFRTQPLAGTGPFRAAARPRGLLLRPAGDGGGGDAQDAPAPEETVRLFGERAALAIARFRAQASDLVLGGSFVDWPIVQQAGIAPANVQIDPAVGLFGLAVTRDEGFLAEPANRAAVAMAIDRRALTSAVREDWAPVETLLPNQLDSAAPPTQPAWAPLGGEERRARARARVAEWRRTHPDPVTLRVALPSGPGATLLWGHIGTALLGIGIEPVLVGIDAPADLRLIDAVAPYDSARWFLAKACLACSAEVRALIEAASEAPDLATRAQRLAAADAALAADAAYIPLAQPLRWSVVALRLTAFQRNARAWHPLNHLRNETR